MALIKSLATPVSQPDINKARLMNVTVDPPKKTMKVQVAQGYEVDGEFIVKSAATHMISSDDYDELMDTLGNPSKSIKESLEEGIWTKLEAMGAIDVS